MTQTKIRVQKQLKQVDIGQYTASSYIDYLNKLLGNNKLYQYYRCGYIDYSMYRILNYITTYNPCESDNYYNNSSIMRYNHLLREFKRVYRQSSNKISLKFYDKIKQYMWLKVQPCEVTL